MFTPLFRGVAAARACATLVIIFLAVLAGCSDGANTPRSALRLRLEAGDAQHGHPGEQLVQPIVVVVADLSGAPVAGMQVRFSVEAGSISPATSVTDAQGRASAVWTLGSAIGVQRGRVSLDDASAITFTAMTTDANQTPDDLPLDEIRTLSVATYDGSGQSVHPDFVRLPARFGPATGLLAITPYPYGNSAQENPSVYESAGVQRWSAPAGLVNPVVNPNGGYLSDPDVVFDPDRGELRLYYREVTTSNIIHVVTSRDAVAWSAPVTVASGTNHTIVSPTVVRRGPADWLMWSVDANVGCSGSSTAVQLRRSVDGTTWSAPESVALSQPGVSPWHLEVQWIPTRNEYWAVFNGKTPGSCTTPAVYLATSRDGVQWTTYPSPLLAHGATPDLQDVVYRSTFDYDPVADEITFWYSGARYDAGRYVWKTAVQRRRRADVFADLARPAAELLANALATRDGVPPLLEAP